MRNGGQALRDMDHGELRQKWGAALDDNTDLWPREDGLTRDRWQLWRDRMQALSTEGLYFEDKTRVVLKEAEEVFTALLDEASTRRLRFLLYNSFLDIH